MDDRAYREYSEESADWLKTARARLLAHLIERHRHRQGPLAILEVGAGVGQNLPTLAEFGTVDAAEINRYGQESIRALGIARQIFANPIPFDLSTHYDVICAMDVVEHIEDDRAALRWLFEHLEPGGILVATVPAYAWLFSDHDRALHHFRRYTAATFVGALPRDALVLTQGYFNHFLFPAAVAARAAWSLKRTILRISSGKQRAPQSGFMARLFGRVLSAELSLIRAGYRPPWGLSAYCVAARPDRK